MIVALAPSDAGQDLDRVVQHVGEGELGGTDDRRSHRRARAARSGPARPARPAPTRQRVEHVLAHEREDPPQHAAEDDHLGVEHVDQAAEPQPERVARARGAGRRRTCRAGGTPRAGASRSCGHPTASATACEPISVSQHPMLPQRQVWPRGLNGLVADLAGVPARAHHRRARRRSRRRRRRRRRRCRSGCSCAGRRRGCAPPARRARRRCRCAPAPGGRSGCVQHRGERDVGPAQVGGEPHQPGAVGDHAGHGQSRRRPGAPSVVAPFSISRIMSTSVSTQRRRGRGWPGWWSTSGPAAGRRARPGRRPSCRPRARRRARRPRRRPGLTSMLGSPGTDALDAARPREWTGVTTSRSSSSRTRSAMVDRFSPIRSVSWARETPPERCTCPRRVARLCRRTASWLVPVPRRRRSATAQVPVADRRRREMASTEAASSSTAPVMM